MSKKLEIPSEYVEKLFDEVRDKTTIPQWVEFKVLVNNKQKNNVCKLVKSNEITELLSEGINFAVIINETIFEQLPTDMQMLVIDRCLAAVSISDTDALSLKKEDFCEHEGVLRKYGYDGLEKLRESIKSLYDSENQKEDEIKSQTKGKRGRKRKAD